MPTKTLFFGKPPEPFFTGTSTAFPNQDLVSLDDEQIKEILLRLDIHALFSPPPAGEYFMAVTDDRHPTHRLLFGKWSGHLEASKNGFVMIGWRRSRHSFSDVKRLVKEFLEANCDVKTIVRNPSQ